MDAGDYFLLAVLASPFIVGLVGAVIIPAYGCSEANSDKEMYILIEASVPRPSHISDYECRYETKTTYPYSEKQTCVRSTNQHGYVVLKEGECD